MTIHLAEMLHRLGYKPVVISRGYKGGAEKRGGIVSDGRTFFMTAEKTGDEPLMMARRLQPIGVPVVVGRNRFRSGMLALRAFRPDVILLDDAYQHLKLWRDLDLVLLDGARPFCNTHLLPRGILREPVSALDRGVDVKLVRPVRI
jgi:tetraacyldisaccharide 4'-kinase